jgi:hypothetical protein
MTSEEQQFNLSLAVCYLYRRRIITLEQIKEALDFSSKDSCREIERLLGKVDALAKKKAENP